MRSRERQIRLCLSLGLLVIVSACDHQVTPPDQPTTAIPFQPDELRSCNAAPPGVLPPPLPRTTEAGLAWGQAAEDLRAQTARIATTCRDRLIRLNRWIDDQR